jgi:hypothetical protein
MYATFSFGIWV